MKKLMALSRIRARQSRSAALALGAALGATQASAQTFEVDFSKPCDPPLLKTKFGVYQTPLTTLPRLLDSIPLLREINVSDFRYEIGWGKPDVLAHDQISGDATRLSYDFSTLDALVGKLEASGARPLLALSYCPNPLKSRTEWAAWKDVPSSLPAWEQINRDYVRHLKQAHGRSRIAYEVWNEPDIPDPSGKMFFSGGPEDYAQLYRHSAAGVRAGDPDAPVGGAAIAYDLRYMAPILSQPLDFASIHAYDNYAPQINNLRGALAARPDLPIFLTEYASFTEFPAEGPQSRHMAAMRFFRDVRGMLAMTDVTKVYWAQWLDAGQRPGMGLISWDGHPKAIFNAFKIYGMMPTDRVVASPDGADGINLLASGDRQSAGVVIWNENTSDRAVKVKLSRLPFNSGTLQLFRIDSRHASVIDNPASKYLQPLAQSRFSRGAPLAWSGVVPAQSVVFLRLLNSAGQRRKPSRIVAPGSFVRSRHWFPDRKSDAYADFDPARMEARLGMGSGDLGAAQVGAVLDNPARMLRVQVEKSGPFQKQDRNSIFGLRLDFQASDGSTNRSVLLHGGLYDAGRDSALPWAGGRATPDHARLQDAMNRGRPFVIDLARLAPAGWNRGRIVLTFLLQNAGRGSRAKWAVSGT